MTVTPYAVAVFALIVCILVCKSPAGKTRLRRYDLARARRARRSEDAAWRRRDEEAELARSLRGARYAEAAARGGHSLSVLDRDEFALGLGEIDGGGD